MYNDAVAISPGRLGMRLSADGFLNANEPGLRANRQSPTFTRRTLCAWVWVCVVLSQRLDGFRGMFRPAGRDVVGLELSCGERGCVMGFNGFLFFVFWGRG